MENNEVLIDEKFLPAAQKLLENAKKSIYISTFKAERTNKPRGRHLIKFFDTVVEKSRLGLDVRVMLNSFSGGRGIPLSNFHTIRALKNLKVKIRYLRNDRTCHAKLLIVDGSTVILGSHNLSIKSCHYNFEVSYQINDINTAQLIHTAYASLWDNAKKA